MNRPIFVASLALLVCALSTLGLGCPQNATLKVENQTSSSFQELNISPEASRVWGENYLSEALVPGAVREVRGIEPGVYDLRAITTGGSTNIWPLVKLEAGKTTTWRLRDAKDGKGIESEVYSLIDAGSTDYQSTSSSGDDSFE